MSSTISHYLDNVLGNYASPPLTLVRGEGSTVLDDEGRGYLDFTSGIAAMALGHSHPVWVDRVQKQAAELVHVSNLFRNPLHGELAARLVRLAGPGRIFLCNSGTEANEALIKLARLHGMQKSGKDGGCAKVLTAKQAFHGRTFGGMAATPQEKIQGRFRPMLPGFAHGTLNDVESFQQLIDDETAAILVETIQGEGGINACTTEFLVGLRQLCDERNLLLMIDEVQCGTGRTGKFFAYEHHGIRPDAIGMAKGLGSGFPMGAIWVDEQYAPLFTPGSHGSTFGGNALACAAALATLDVIEEEDLLIKVTERSEVWIGKLKKLQEKHPAKIKEVRGMGYLVALGMDEAPTPLVAALRERGLLTVPAGNNAIRLLPPLTVAEEDLDRSVRVIDETLTES